MLRRFFYFPTPTAATGCDTDVAPVQFNDCAPEINLSEIRRIFVAKPIASNFTNWTQEAEWLTRLNDSATAGDDYIRTLVVRGNKPAPTPTTKTLTNDRQLNIYKAHVLNFLIDESNEVNHEFVRETEAITKYKIWYETFGGQLYGGNEGIIAYINLNMVLNEGPEEITTYNGIFTWKSKFTEERTESPIFDIGNTGSVTVYDTALEFSADATDAAAGVTVTIGAIDPVVKYEFNAISLPTGAPTTMEIKLSGIGVATVDFPADYIGHPFRYTDASGGTHNSAFVDGEVNF